MIRQSCEEVAPSAPSMSVEENEKWVSLVFGVFAGPAWANGEQNCKDCLRFIHDFRTPVSTHAPNAPGSSLALLRGARIIVAMTVNEILAQLKSLGDDARRAHNTKAGAPDNQFGVKLGDIRAMAKKIKADHELALNLWDTGNVEAQLLATLIIKPKSLSADELEKLTRSTTCAGGRLAELLCCRTASREGNAA